MIVLLIFGVLAVPHHCDAPPFFAVVREIDGLIEDLRVAEERPSAELMWELLATIQTRLNQTVEAAMERAEDHRRWRAADIDTIMKSGGFGDSRMALLLYLLLGDRGDSVLSDSGLAGVSEQMQLQAN